MIDRTKLRYQLDDGLRRLSLVLSDEQASALVNYVGELHRWNRAFNLTAIREANAMMERHVIESLSILPGIPTSARTLLDVGTGAGLPGLPIAVARPELRVSLLDSNGKKARFLRQCARVLQLPLEVLEQRLETLRPTAMYDVITARALDDPMALWRKLDAHLNVPAGRFVAMIGAQQKRDLANHPDVQLSCEPTRADLAIFSLNTDQSA